MLTQVEGYRKIGWSIFPCGEKSKMPHVKSWSRYTTRVPTDDEIKAWFGRNDRNVAIVCGAISGIVVIDVDTTEEEVLSMLPDTGCIARTGGGGRHYLYRYPKGIQRVNNYVNLFGKKIDIRADGGYIVAPPSKHESGRRYEWIKFDPSNLSPAPIWAINPDPKIASGRSEKDRWLNDLLENGAPEGERNNSLIRIAGYYAKCGLPFDVAVTLCFDWNKKLKAPLSHKEIRSTVSSAYKLQSKSALQKSEQRDDVDALPMLGLGSFLSKYGSSQTKWIIDKWLPEKTIAFLISPPQCYKTYISFDLAISVATGKPFLGKYPVNSPGGVAIYQQEDNFSSLAERSSLILMAKHQCLDVSIRQDRIELPNILHLGDYEEKIQYHDMRRLRFDDPKILSALEEYLKIARPKLVIVDPLYSAVNTDEYMVKAAEQILELKALRDKYDTSFLIVHHTGKNLVSWNRERAWGSQFINASMETSWLLRKNSSNNTPILKRHFKDEGIQPLVKIGFDIETEALPWKYNVTACDISDKEASNILDGVESVESLEPTILDFLSKHGELSTQEIANKLQITELICNENLFNLYHRHQIQRKGKDRWKSLEVMM